MDVCLGSEWERGAQGETWYGFSESSSLAGVAEEEGTDSQVYMARLDILSMLRGRKKEEESPVEGLLYFLKFRECREAVPVLGRHHNDEIY